MSSLHDVIIKGIYIPQNKVEETYQGILSQYSEEIVKLKRELRKYTCYSCHNQTIIDHIHACVDCNDEFFCHDCYEKTRCLPCRITSDERYGKCKQCPWQFSEYDKEDNIQLGICQDCCELKADYRYF